MAQRQRKGTPPQGAGGNNTVFYIVLGVIALAGIIAIAYALAGGGGTTATDPIDLETANVQELYERATPLRLGDENAPVKIVEFADFQCPGCGVFSLQVKPRLMPYIERGQAQLVYYDFPLGGSHVHSFLAARAARCGGEQQLEGRDAYWAMHDKLYQEQSDWAAEQDAADEFVDYAAEIGLDRREFERCLRSDRFADVVTANRRLGEQLGVASTPTVLINNRLVGGRTIQDMGDQLLTILQEIVQEEGGAGQ
ncbi:MAG TPA: DsbA family protein [Longimicrobiales bacterium]|nr:DsbA family protein [Longimicrobiales bacterium]